MPKDPYGELKAAKKLGGRPQINSGRLWFSKGDFVVDDDLFDRKETRRGSYTITRTDWENLRKDAIKTGKSPALQIVFLSEEHDVNLVVITEERYAELLRDAAKGETSPEKPTLGESLRSSEGRISGLLDSLKSQEQKPRRRKDK